MGSISSSTRLLFMWPIIEKLIVGLALMLVGHKNFDEKSFSSNFLREYNSEHSNSLIYSNFFKNTIILKKILLLRDIAILTI